MKENVSEKISNHDVVLKFKTTLIRLGVVKGAPREFKHFLVWFKELKKYGDSYVNKDDIISS